MSAVATIRRAVGGAPPPLSAARQRLAEAIAAKAEADDRLRTLESVRHRAYAAIEAAEAALATASADATKADQQAHELRIADLMGRPRPGIPTRAEANAALRAAQDEVRDAEAAWRAISAEADALQAAARERDERVNEAAVAVLREESNAAVTALVDELYGLHRKMVERHLLLTWLIRESVTTDTGPRSLLGVSELVNRTFQPPATWSNWRGESAATAAWAAALEALKVDAAAAVPR